MSVSSVAGQTEPIVQQNQEGNMFSSTLSRTRNAFSGIGSAIYSYIPSSSQVLKNINKIAIPAIGLAAASYVPGASAGPWAACACIVACTGLIEAPPLYAACLAACGVAATIPGP